MPVFGMICLLAGIAIFIFTNMHAPEKALTDVPWVYKPEYYYLFIVTAICFVLYGIYEIAVELMNLGGGNKEEGLPAVETKKCPRCAELIRNEAKVCRYCHYEFSDAEIIQAKEEKEKLIARKSRRFYIAIATGLGCAILLGGGFFAWQTMRHTASQTFQPDGKTEVQPSDNTKAGPLPAEKSPVIPKPATPPSPDSSWPFQVGSEWAIDWQSRYHYRGLLQIKRQLAPNQYLSRIAVSFVTKRKNRITVFMDGLVTIRGQEVVINCRNPSVSWWDTDDFYLKWDHHKMTGYNVDKKGRRGRAVFTLVEGT